VAATALPGETLPCPFSHYALTREDHILCASTGTCAAGPHPSVRGLAAYLEARWSRQCGSSHLGGLSSRYVTRAAASASTPPRGRTVGAREHAQPSRGAQVRAGLRAVLWRADRVRCGWRLHASTGRRAGSALANLRQSTCYKLQPRSPYSPVVRDHTDDSAGH